MAGNGFFGEYESFRIFIFNNKITGSYVMQFIFSFFRAIPSAKQMDAWAGPAIFILLFLANLAYVSFGGTMEGL